MPPSPWLQHSGVATGRAGGRPYYRALPIRQWAGEMEAGDLIADAQFAATAPAGFGGAEIAFMNPGGVRNPGFDTAGATYPHDVTYQEAFTVQPFGNGLWRDVLRATERRAGTTVRGRRLRVAERLY